MRSEHRRQPGMVVFRQPQREDIELVVAREHRIKSREIAKRLFHHLRSCIDEDPMYCWSGIAELFRAMSREQQPQRVFPLGLLVERANDLTQIVDTVVRGLGSCAGVKRSGIASAHHSL